MVRVDGLKMWGESFRSMTLDTFAKESENMAGRALTVTCHYKLIGVQSHGELMEGGHSLMQV